MTYRNPLDPKTKEEELIILRGLLRDAKSQMRREVHTSRSGSTYRYIDRLESQIRKLEAE